MNDLRGSRFPTQLLLIALSLLLVGGMAARAVLQEFNGMEVQKRELGSAYLVQVEQKLLEAVTRESLMAVQRARESVGEEVINGPRRLILKAKRIVFLAAYSESARLFPPEETTAIRVRERRYIEDLSAPIRLLRDRLMDKPLVMAWVPQYSGTILSCHRTPDELDLCVLMRSEYLKELLSAELQSFSPQDSGWNVSIKPTQVAVPSDASLLSHTLADPLNEWRLLAQADDREQGANKAWVLLSIILPLVVSAAALTFYFRRQRQWALEDSERRSLLTAQLSHELRTPITNLTLYVDLLKRKSGDSAEVERYADVIAEEVERLGTLSHQAIAVARGQPIDNGSAPINVDDVIEGLIHRYKHFFDRSSCDVTFDGGVKEVVNLDQVALESIVLQLLENACKYASPGKVEISSAQDNERITVSVRDYGSGISESLIEQVFEANVRCPQSEYVPGFGLGLATARYLASLNNGDLRAENMNPGARFILTFKTREAM